MHQFPKTPLHRQGSDRVQGSKGPGSLASLTSESKSLCSKEYFKTESKPLPQAAAVQLRNEVECELELEEVGFG